MVPPLSTSWPIPLSLSLSLSLRWASGGGLVWSCVALRDHCEDRSINGEWNAYMSRATPKVIIRQQSAHRRTFWGSDATNKLIHRSEKYESENELFDDNLIAFQKSRSYLKETEQLGLGTVISVTAHMRKVGYKWIWILSHKFNIKNTLPSQSKSSQIPKILWCYFFVRLNEWWQNQSRFSLRCESFSCVSF